MGNEQTDGLAEPGEGCAVVEKSSGEAVRPRPRVQAIDRQQGWLRSVVVEEFGGGGPFLEHDPIFALIGAGMIDHG
jgi:hypothetical protein